MGMSDLVKSPGDQRMIINDVFWPEVHAGSTGSLSFLYDTETYTVKGGKLYNSKTEVAVVYSPGYGGGFSNDNENINPTDARVAVLVLMGAEGTLIWERWGEPQEYHIKGDRFWTTSPDFTNGLAIQWVPGGTLYRIDEYDGYESVETAKDVEWRIA